MHYILLILYLAIYDLCIPPDEASPEPDHPVADIMSIEPYILDLRSYYHVALTKFQEEYERTDMILTYFINDPNHKKRESQAVMHHTNSQSIEE